MISPATQLCVCVLGGGNSQSPIGLHYEHGYFTVILKLHRLWEVMWAHNIEVRFIQNIWGTTIWALIIYQLKSLIEAACIVGYTICIGWSSYAFDILPT
jgi:hypothetical protein